LIFAKQVSHIDQRADLGAQILNRKQLSRTKDKPVDARVRKLLRELSEAINESVSNSGSVNEQIQRIRDCGYEIYVYLDATIGLERDGEEIEVPSDGDEVIEARPKRRRAEPLREVQFRIDVNDLSFLRSVGIDPTRKVKSPRASDAKRSGELEN
jgi:hypothetical protein